MPEVADIVRLHGAAYRAKFQDRLLPSHKRALRDIQACRTPFFGGHVHQCDHCGKKVYSYHSCRNRSCPKCHQNQTEEWLAQQRPRLLPCSYYLLTFTLPEELRSLARSHQKIVYGLLMKTAASALQKLALDSRYLGGRVGALAVLHTWTRAMLYHPHVHMLVTAGGLSSDGSTWIPPKNPAFLVPVRALSRIFRGKMRAAFKKQGLLQQTSFAVWEKEWVVHCQHAGSGTKVLDYLGRYIYRVAITNSRLERVDDGHVIFRYRDNRTHQVRRVTLSGIEFLHRFLQHVLPLRFAKVRYYGIWSPSSPPQLDHARLLLSAAPDADLPVPVASSHHNPPIRCPHCRIGNLILRETLTPQRTRSP